MTSVLGSVLVLGGARSGKTAFAETLLLQSLPPMERPLYLATGQAGDSEMASRIAHHRAARGEHWETVEEPLALAEALERLSGRSILVDCVTLWLTNLLLAGSDIEMAVDRLVAAIAARSAPVLLVSNEVGWGIVPDNALARAFRDHAGRANQRLAAVCHKVVLVAAGLPLILKDRGGADDAGTSRE